MQTVFQKETASVVIPAYNNPEYTRKALKSVVEQEYRPIEVIISDDHSPISLEMLVKEFEKFQNDRFKIRYYRQPSNLGMMDNFTFTVKQATGKYLVPLAHDNCFIDRGFISEAVKIMEANPNCNLSIGNAVYENSNLAMLKLPDNVKAKDGWKILEGDNFIRLWRSGGMGWTPSLVLDYQIANSLGAFDEPFIVNRALSQKLNLAGDNVFAYVFVLSSIGSVALTGKATCKVGTPESAYSRSRKWRKARAKVKFILFYNIYKANMTGSFAQAVKEMARKQAVEQAVKTNIFDLKIMQHYNFSSEIIYFMCLSLLKRPRRFRKKLKKKLKHQSKLRLDKIKN
jgi:glycosyltransferase involved in cell wall biosynthesis